MMATKTKAAAPQTGHEAEIRDYARFFESNRLAELSIETKAFKITLKKQAVAPAPVAAPAVVASPSTAPEKAAEDAPAKKSTGKEIRSPIVGTFYASPAPDSPAYVKVGDEVQASTKVCIVEAMKNMNEIAAGLSGRVIEILVKNGQAVQAGQVLMILE